MSSQKDQQSRTGRQAPLGDIETTGGFGLTRTDWRILIAVFLLALAVRGVYLWQSARQNPTFYVPVVDAETYHTMACALLGRVTSDSSYALQREVDATHAGFFWQPFFYPFFLSVVYFFAGPSILTAKIVQMAIGGATCSLTYLLGRVVFSRKVGVVAAVIVAFYGPLIFLEGELLGEGLAAFWSLVLILLFLRLRGARSYWTPLAIGFFGAVAVLTRPTFLPFLIAASIWAAWVLYRAGGRGKLLPALCNGLAGFIIVAFPVAWLNYSRTGNFAILPSSGGINFYIGNNPDVSKTLTIRPGWAWEQLTTWPEREGVQGDAKQQAFFYGQVRKYAMEHPLSFVGGIATKAVRFISGREIPRNYDVYVFGRWSSLLAAMVWKAGPFGFPFGLLLPLVVAGVVCSWRRIPVVLVLFILIYSLGVIMVFVTGRYRVPVIPPMSVIAAAGAVGLVDLLRCARWRRLALTVACLAVTVAAGTVPGPFPEEQGYYEAELYFDLGVVHRRMSPPRYAKAEEYLRKAVEIKGDYVDAYNELGNMRALQGDLAGAYDNYLRAVTLDPTHAKAIHNVGLMALKLGRNDEAIERFGTVLALNPRLATTHFFLGQALIKTGDCPAAVEHLQKALELLDPATDGQHILQAHLSLAEALSKIGRHPQAVEQYRMAMKTNPDYLGALEGFAWLLATCQDASIRNGPQAVGLAERAAVASGGRGDTLDVLAAAYAEAGRFTDAVNTATKALAIAEMSPRPVDAEEVRARLKLYQSGRPYRQGDMEPSSQPEASGISQ